MNFRKQPWKNDVRSKAFSHNRFFGTIAPQLLPDTLGRPRASVEDQGNTTRCAAYAASKNGEYQHGARMSPDWQTDKISRIQGTPVDSGGSDPNAAMASQMYEKKGGYLPRLDWNPANGAQLDTEAQDYGEQSYLKPDGGADIFDSICNALYLAYDHDKKLGACVQAFSGWYSSFNTPYITKIDDGSSTTFGSLRQQHSFFKAIWHYGRIKCFGSLDGYHSYLFIDFEQVNGESVLVIQNSYLNIGDGGFQRMTRAVVNELFSKWGTSLKIPKPLTPSQLLLAKQSTPFGNLQRLIIQAWYNLSLLIASRFGV